LLINALKLAIPVVGALIIAVSHPPAGLTMKGMWVMAVLFYMASMFALRPIPIFPTALLTLLALWAVTGYPTATVFCGWANAANRNMSGVAILNLR